MGKENLTEFSSIPLPDQMDSRYTPTTVYSRRWGSGWRSGRVTSLSSIGEV
jgi:hypothetical protein